MYRIILMYAFVIFFVKAGAQTDTQSIWDDGINFLRKNDYLRGAEKMTDFIWQDFPHSAVAYYNRGVCWYNLGDPHGACQDWTKARSMGYRMKEKAYKFTCDSTYKIKLLKKEFYPHQKIYPELGYRPKYTRADSLRGALRPERTCFDVYFYDLTVRIFPGKKEISGQNVIWFHGVHTSEEIQLDLFSNYTIHKISMDGQNLSYRREYNAIFITIPGKVQPGKDYKLTVAYSGKPRKAPNPPWDGGFVWSHDGHLHRWDAVACEQLGASSWWPVKDHLSDRPDSMAINIEAPSRYRVVCNGRLRGVKKLDHHYSRYEWFVDYPINSYNVTFYMGKYVQFTDTIPWRDTFLIAKYNVLPWHLKKARAQFKQARQVVDFYNDAYGPFPFWKDNYGLVESPYEGMENQTAIAYGDAFSNKKNSEMYLNKEYDYIIVHETAHEWWGNSVAASDMADIWIHEGFATYSEMLFLEHELGYNKSIAELNHGMQNIFNVWPVVQNRNVNENSFAGNDCYYKGAALLECLRATINNDSLFRSILHDFQMTYRDSTITSDTFIRYVNKRTQHNYSPLFDIYLYHTQLPVLAYSYTRQGDDLVLNYRWTGVEKGFEMPFAIKLFDSDGSVRLVGTTKEQQVVLPHAASFNFYNYTQSTKDIPHNGLTYYHTKCENPPPNVKTQFVDGETSGTNSSVNR